MLGTDAGRAAVARTYEAMPIPADIHARCCELSLELVESLAYSFVWADMVDVHVREPLHWTDLPFRLAKDVISCSEVRQADHTRSRAASKNLSI